jgi:putative inorganic carbon (HCO3(-)) transporter
MLFKLKQPNNSLLLFSAVSIAVILSLVSLFFITDNFFVLLVLLTPFVLVSLFVDYRYILYLLLFSLPLSVNLRIDKINLNIDFPSEPFIGLLAIVALIFIFSRDKKTDILTHTLSKLLFFYWLTLVISFAFSTMPMVSLKTLIISSSYLLVFYYLLSYYLINNNWNVKQPFLLYAFSLFGIVLFTVWKHSNYGFNKDYAATIVEPFFSDHTIYGACLSFMIPICAILYFRADKLGMSFFQKSMVGFFLIFFLVGIYLSHSRATWISLVSLSIVVLILKYRISFSSLMSFFAILLLIAFLNMDALMPLLVKNKNDSKDKRANLEEQVRSVTNIKNDVSNTERINRWQCAVRMVKEKPLTGFGIGTYQFNYITFQKESEMTVISVTSAKNNYAQGMGGTAHSEYLLTLSENGLFSGFALLAIVLYSIYLGMKLYYKGTDDIKYYALMIMLSLVTYFLHGVFNNFLTTDKAAFLVWGGLAVLCVLDIKYKRNEKI